ncbi:MAG TPA: DbpA RNA binding domain-containing protein, partial [Longimicrobium sp.]|nr:DbpA RNA binding domain-containing protein [Longimicrobium sp.]
MASFQDLGLREPLLRALEDEGLDRPTALQAAAIPVLRREGNLVARASSGAGRTLAYGLGVLDRLKPRAEPEGGGGEGDEGGETTPPGTRLLVLRPSGEDAARTALELVPYAHALDLTVAGSGGGWGTPAGQADVLVATPGEVLEAVRTSGVKLEGVEAVVVDGASEISALGGWEALETLFDHVPRDAQRVVVTAESSEGVEDLVSRRVKRAMRYPAEAALEDQAEEVAAAGIVGYVPVNERDKVNVAARLLGGGGDDAAPVLYCRTDERAAQVAEALALRGFAVGDADDPDVDVAVVGAHGEDDDEEGSAAGTAISFDVPPDEETLRARHSGEFTGFVLVEPRELAHLRQIAKRAGFQAQPAGIAGEEPSPSAAELRGYRGQLRRAIREEDLAAQMLILEPLFEDFTPIEVAAAASALLRRKAPPPPEPGAAPAPRVPRTTRAPAVGSVDAGPPPSAIARLFVSVGERDGVRASDLVGAIAGEADLPGSAIGKIDIRDTFSIVEVPSDAAERVIQSLNGTTMRGRALRVDYDRQRRTAGPGGPRREDRG